MPCLLNRILTVLVVAATACWLGGGAAGASPATATWTVSNPNGDGSFTVAVQEMVITNTHNGDVIRCPDPRVTQGTLRSGTYTGQQLVDIGELSAEYGCTDAAGTTVTVHQLPWRFQAESYDAAAGQASGVIFSSQFVPFVVERPGCTYIILEWFDPAATLLEFTYTNSTATLRVGSFSGPGLTVGDRHGDGCGGLAEEGDIIDYASTYTIFPRVTIVGS